MHILVTNDDGPPSTTASPYVLDLVRQLQANGHTVSVVLPDTQRSWIGKAHMVGQAIKPSYYLPPALPLPPAVGSSASSADGGKEMIADDLSYVDSGRVSATRSAANKSGDKHEEEWILINSTPASCAQIGLFHYFQDRGPIDLVVSGPNYGRNSTAVFALSSGTLGGAFEAAVCGHKAIALSYAFFDCNDDPYVVRCATRVSVRLIEHLYKQWEHNDRTSGQQVDVYTVNVPLVKDVESAKVLWTHMLRNKWSSGSCFTEIKSTSQSQKNDYLVSERGEEQIRNKEAVTAPQQQQSELESERETAWLNNGHKNFKWAPSFADVHKSVEEAPPGNDGWAVSKGHISVTPLQANFMQVSGLSGQLEF